MHPLAKSVARKIPLLNRAIAKRDRLEAEIAELRRLQGFVPPGHFYSPIPSWDEIHRDEAAIFGARPRTFPGIDMREEEQLRLFDELAAYYDTLPFQAEKQDGLRYYYENTNYSYSDAILLYCMIRHLKPRRIIEVGSGYSSCVMLDTNDRFFGGSIELTFAEPYPALLESLMGPEGRSAKSRIIPTRLQDIDLAEFKALEPGDILFIDSTHISKIHSDVNRILFDVFPALAPGVYIHIHDIFYPFEYPKVWLDEGRAWNEIYILRAFLQYNSAFRIAIMNTYLHEWHPSIFRERMPLCLKNPGGSIWLRKDTV